MLHPRHAPLFLRHRWLRLVGGAHTSMVPLGRVEMGTGVDRRHSLLLPRGRVDTRVPPDHTRTHTQEN